MWCVASSVWCVVCGKWCVVACVARGVEHETIAIACTVVQQCKRTLVATAPTNTNIDTYTDTQTHIHIDT